MYTEIPRTHSEARELITQHLQRTPQTSVQVTGQISQVCNWRTHTGTKERALSSVSIDVSTGHSCSCSVLQILSGSRSNTWELELNTSMWQCVTNPVDRPLVQESRKRRVMGAHQRFITLLERGLGLITTHDEATGQRPQCYWAMKTSTHEWTSAGDQAVTVHWADGELDERWVDRAGWAEDKGRDELMGRWLDACTDDGLQECQTTQIQFRSKLLDPPRTFSIFPSNTAQCSNMSYSKSFINGMYTLNWLNVYYL